MTASLQRSSCPGVKVECRLRLWMTIRIESLEVFFRYGVKLKRRRFGKSRAGRRSSGKKIPVWNCAMSWETNQEILRELIVGSLMRSGVHLITMGSLYRPRDTRSGSRVMRLGGSGLPFPVTATSCPTRISGEYSDCGDAPKTSNSPLSGVMTMFSQLKLRRSSRNL